KSVHDYEVPKSTLWHRDHDQIPTSKCDEWKQYLTSGEKQALVNWYKLKDYCFPPQIALVKEMAKYLHSKWDSEKARSIGYNWHLSFLACHPELGIKYSRQIEHVQVK
ncbi:hypothetical protein C7212DRAFT_69176, partial [Tuber magnatum]